MKNNRTTTIKKNKIRLLAKKYNMTVEDMLYDALEEAFQENKQLKHELNVRAKQLSNRVDTLQLSFKVASKRNQIMESAITQVLDYIENNVEDEWGFCETAHVWGIEEILKRSL